MAAPQLSNGLSRLKRASGHDAPATASTGLPASTQSLAGPRAGQVQIAAHFDPAVRKQLTMIGTLQDRDNRDLLAEALNDLFVKHGYSAIAPVYGEGSKSKPRGK